MCESQRKPGRHTDFVARLASRSPQREMTSNLFSSWTNNIALVSALLAWAKNRPRLVFLHFSSLSLKKKNMMFLPNYHAISRPKSACHTSTSLLKNNQGKIPLFSGEKKTWRDQNCPYHSRFQVRYTTNAYISCAENSPIVGFVGFIPQLTWRPCHPLEAGRDVPWFQSTIEA